jgi:hypothetical protein
LAADPKQLALQAVSRALVDPTPKVMHGAKGKPCFFEAATAPMKQAATHCLENRWVEGTGVFVGGGKSKKELFRVTPAGIKTALEKSEPAQLLGDAVGYLERSVKEVEGLRASVDAMLAGVRSQKDLVHQLFERIKPPDVERLLQGFKQDGKTGTHPTAGKDWLQDVLGYLVEYKRRNPMANCPLPELFRNVAGPRGLTIGQFHDGLRDLASRGQLRLHPHTGAAYQLQDEQYALVAGQEIKYYAEPIGNP